MAGTWVVQSARATLAVELAAGERPWRRFPDAALDLYGVFELQALKAVLRGDDDDRGFLFGFYEALCAQLERGLLVGRRRENRNAR